MNLRKLSLWAAYTILAAVLLTGCAHVSPHAEDCITNDPYGFWGGLWHGMILPFSWLASLFSDNIAIYAYNNNGGWYDFGFSLGVGAFSGFALKEGGGKASKYNDDYDKCKKCGKIIRYDREDGFWDSLEENNGKYYLDTFQLYNRK